MPGLYQSVSSVPVSSSTTKLHSAISPSMNDQWSGKTLRICFLARPASPVRSSAQVATPAMGLALGALAAFLPLVVAVLICSSPTFPVAGADRLGEVALGHQVAVAVHRDGQLGERTSRWT